MRDSRLALNELNLSDSIRVPGLGEYLSQHARLGTEFAQGGAEAPDPGDDGAGVHSSESLTVTTLVKARSAIMNP